MRAGELNRSIVVQRNEGTDTDSFGKPVDVWTKIHTDDFLSAKIDYSSGSEIFSSQQFVGKLTAVFKIRYRQDITPLNRIVFDGRNWNIFFTKQIGQREGLEIYAYTRSE